MWNSISYSDYVNGIITYSIPDKDIDETYLLQVEIDREKERQRNRVRTKFPMSQFYIYEDKVPDNTRVSTPEDCKICEDKVCHNSKHCLITERPIPKKCFNHCPKCDATDPNIEWGEKEWGCDQAWQSATCNKCNCEFTETYDYVYSEIEEPEET